MDVEFIAGFSPITPDADRSAAFYRDALDLPLEADQGYLSTGELEGAKHFGVWPLSSAALSCFGTNTWPEGVTIPQATLEFEMRSPQAVAEGMGELIEAGYDPIHTAKLEPWGQTIARLLSPEGLLIGLSFAPWLHGK